MNQPAETESAEAQPKVSLAQSSPTVGTFRERDGALEWSGRQETLRIEPWGPDAVRVRARLGGPVLDDLPGALLDEPPATESTVRIVDGEGRLTVGSLTVEVSAEGLVRFLRTDDLSEILAEQRAHFWSLDGGPLLAVLTLAEPTPDPYAYTSLTAGIVAEGVHDVHLGLRGPLRLAHVGFSG